MKFWELRNENGHGTVYIYGEIEAVKFWGDELTPQTIKEELDACSGPLDVYINSGGGDVFAGQAIYNQLKRYDGDVTVHIDGLAASIASVIAMAGDKIVMPANALLMIHNAWARSAGDAKAHREMANTLEKANSTIVGIYAARAGGEAQTFADYMDAETWFTAEEALEAGLVDEVEANKAVAACLKDGFAVINGQRVDVSRYAHGDKLWDMAANGTDNGGEGQPVQDSNPALEAQRDRFRAMKRRILETIDH